MWWCENDDDILDIAPLHCQRQPDFLSSRIIWGSARFRWARPPGPRKPPPGPSSRRWALHLTLPTPLPRQFVRGLGAPLEQSTEYLLRAKARPRGRCPRSDGQEAATTVDAEAADRAQALGAGPARRAVDAVPVTRGARHRVDPDGLLSSSPTCRRPPARDVRPRDRTARRRAAAVARAGHLLACVADGRRSCKSPAPARACSGPTGARARGDASSLPRHRRAGIVEEATTTGRSRKEAGGGGTQQRRSLIFISERSVALRPSGDEGGRDREVEGNGSVGLEAVRGRDGPDAADEPRDATCGKGASRSVQRR